MTDKRWNDEESINRDISGNTYLHSFHSSGGFGAGNGTGTAFAGNSQAEQGKTDENKPGTAIESDSLLKQIH